MLPPLVASLIRVEGGRTDQAQHTSCVVLKIDQIKALTTSRNKADQLPFLFKVLNQTESVLRWRCEFGLRDDKQTSSGWKVAADILKEEHVFSKLIGQHPFVTFPLAVHVRPVCQFSSTFCGTLTKWMCEF